MCNDTVNCLKDAHKRALRTMEKVLKDADTELDTAEIDKLHHLLEILKDTEKLIASQEETEA